MGTAILRMESGSMVPLRRCSVSHDRVGHTIEWATAHWMTQSPFHLCLARAQDSKPEHCIVTVEYSAAIVPLDKLCRKRSKKVRGLYSTETKPRQQIATPRTLAAEKRSGVPE
jgi:hypothetical protein